MMYDGSLLLESENSNVIREHIHIVRVLSHAHTIQIDHAYRADRVQVIHVDVLGLLTLDAEDAGLAALSIGLVRARCTFLN